MRNLGSQSFSSFSSVWIGENDSGKMLVWMNRSCFVFAEEKTDTLIFENISALMGPESIIHKNVAIYFFIQKRLNLVEFFTCEFL